MIIYSLAQKATFLKGGSKLNVLLVISIEPLNCTASFSHHHHYHYYRVVIAKLGEDFNIFRDHEKKFQRKWAAEVKKYKVL